MSVKPIVVAVDGSDPALRAAGWAAAEARRRGRRLRIVHIYEWPLRVYGPAIVDGADLLAALETAADFGVDAETEVLRGPVVPVLREVSEHAALLVLGSRGLGGFTGLLAGSVSVTLAAHAHCPVVVVRGDEPDPGGPVVVGVDGSPASEEAVALAFDEAAVRGVDLVAVHAWTDTPMPLTPAGGHVPELDWTALAEEAAETLAERLAGWREKYPQVSVRRVVEHDRPAHALLEAATDAGLLVVGSRGRGGFAGLTLGSVSQAVIHHADCPVIVARPVNT
jgi:nucleotide-binding universal stress UspA family protein